MKKNNIYTQVNKNLLTDPEFYSQLKFEANYASNARGGHFPYYQQKERQKSLVSPVNLLTSEELQLTAVKYFISNN